MAKKNTIEGFRKVKDNLNREVKKIKKHSMKGLIGGAIIIRRDMEVTSPTIPVDLGNLRASWFIVTAQSVEGGAPEFKGGKAAELSSEHSTVVSEARALVQTVKDPLLAMGFSANYAIHVHENIGASFQRPGAGAKFFESSLQRNTDAVLREIASNTQIR